MRLNWRAFLAVYALLWSWIFVPALLMIVAREMAR